MEDTLVRKMLKSALVTVMSMQTMEETSADIRKANDKVVHDLNTIFTEKVNPTNGQTEFYLNTVIS